MLMGFKRVGRCWFENIRCRWNCYGGENPITIAQYLGIHPEWIDGTSVGGCSFMMHIRHSLSAISSGLQPFSNSKESGKSNSSPEWPWPPRPGSYEGQLEGAFWYYGAARFANLPFLRYMEDYNITVEDLAMFGNTREGCSKP